MYDSRKYRNIYIDFTVIVESNMDGKVSGIGPKIKIEILV